MPGRKGREDDKFLAHLWWVPLTWATNILGRMGVNAPKQQMVVPKDHKDVISSMQKYKKDLENQKTCGDNSLPSFYKKVFSYRRPMVIGAYNIVDFVNYSQIRSRPNILVSTL